jgi:hypothetical protein
MNRSRVTPPPRPHLLDMNARFACCLLTAFLLGGAAGAQAQPAGLLLGLRHQEAIAKPLPYYTDGPDSLSRTVYTTYLIVRQDGEVSLAGEASGLRVPREDRFWKVDVKRSIYNNWVEDFIWAAPAGETPALTGIDAFNGEYCRGHRIQRIRFAGADYLALDQQSAGYCEDAAHPWNFNTLAVIPLDSTQHLGVPISRILGAAGREAFLHAADQFRAQAAPGRLPYVEEPDEASWSLRRGQGYWAVQGRLDPQSEAEQGTFVDLTLPVAPSPALAPQQDLYLPWDSVAAVAPHAVDAFSSPQRDLLVILHPDSLSVHPVAASRIGPPTFSIPIEGGSRTVMAQWATGARVGRWVDHFRRPDASSLP